jgi:hypothetical protein
MDGATSFEEARLVMWLAVERVMTPKPHEIPSFNTNFMREYRV